MRCHYEMLELSLGINSTVDEIKRQYRRLALQWHPDKNAGREEEATARFKDIGHAYAVLSDPRERKWYSRYHTSSLSTSSLKPYGIYVLKV
jgi:curved DNA-binding protein CbpA